MRNKALTLSDGSKVRLSKHQIELLGPDESAAAKRIENGRNVRVAVSMWVTQTSEMVVQAPQSGEFYKKLSASQKRAGSARATYKLANVSKGVLADADLSGVRSWVIKSGKD